MFLELKCVLGLTNIFITNCQIWWGVLIIIFLFNLVGLNSFTFRLICVKVKSSHFLVVIHSISSHSMSHFYFSFFISFCFHVFFSRTFYSSLLAWYISPNDSTSIKIQKIRLTTGFLCDAVSMIKTFAGFVGFESYE